MKHECASAEAVVAWAKYRGESRVQPGTLYFARPANIIAGSVLTLVNGAVTFVVPLVTVLRPPAFPEYLFFGTLETVCTGIIIRQAWAWSGGEGTSEQDAGHSRVGSFAR